MLNKWNFMISYYEIMALSTFITFASNSGLRMYKKSMLLILSILCIVLKSEATDSIPTATTFTGSIGITNNGFSIIPIFSLNNPAAVIILSLRKNKFSFEPDFRLVPNVSKGGMLFWLRYHAIERKKFSLRLSLHPAFSFIRRTVMEDGKEIEITEMLRFLTSEIVPVYKITPDWNISASYLQGNGLQNHGPQTSHVLFLNTSVSNMNIGGNFRFQIIPSVYYLFLDDAVGKYVTATGIVSHKKSPFTLSSTFNKTLKSDIAGNKDFLWNITLGYNFSKRYVRIL